MPLPAAVTCLVCIEVPGVAAPCCGKSVCTPCGDRWYGINPTCPHCRADAGCAECETARAAECTVEGVPLCAACADDEAVRCIDCRRSVHCGADAMRWCPWCEALVCDGCCEAGHDNCCVA